MLELTCSAMCDQRQPLAPVSAFPLLSLMLAHSLSRTPVPLQLQLPVLACSLPEMNFLTPHLSKPRHQGSAPQEGFGNPQPCNWKTPHSTPESSQQLLLYVGQKGILGLCCWRVEYSEGIS